MTTRVISEASRNATLKDVARLAGVSVSTASKALNGRKDVGEATRVRVVHAARAARLLTQRAGQRPHRPAQRHGRAAHLRP